MFNENKAATSSSDFDKTTLLIISIITTAVVVLLVLFILTNIVLTRQESSVGEMLSPNNIVDKNPVKTLVWNASKKDYGTHGGVLMARPGDSDIKLAYKRLQQGLNLTLDPCDNFHAFVCSSKQKGSTFFSMESATMERVLSLVGKGPLNRAFPNISNVIYSAYRYCRQWFFEQEHSARRDFFRSIIGPLGISAGEVINPHTFATKMADAYRTYKFPAIFKTRVAIDDSREIFLDMYKEQFPNENMIVEMASLLDERRDRYEARRLVERTRRVQQIIRRIPHSSTIANKVVLNNDETLHLCANLENAVRASERLREFTEGFCDQTTQCCWINADVAAYLENEILSLPPQQLLLTLQWIVVIRHWDLVVFNPLDQADNPLACEKLIYNTFPFLTQYLVLHRFSRRNFQAQQADSIHFKRFYVDTILNYSIVLRNGRISNKIRQLRRATICLGNNCLATRALAMIENEIESVLETQIASHIDTSASYFMLFLKQYLEEYVSAMFPSDVKYDLFNAQFRPTLNTVMVGLSFSTAPMYFLEAPLWLKHATYMFVLGHELSHQMFNAEDDPRFTQVFYDRIACFMLQYQQQPLPKAGASPPKSYLKEISEVGADILAIPVAYEYFLKYGLGKSDRRVRNPSMLRRFSEKKLYFFAMCASLCGGVYPDQKPDRLDPHPIHSERCNIPLRNSLQFSKAYGCRRGSYMNPREKCAFFNS